MLSVQSVSNTDALSTPQHTAGYTKKGLAPQVVYTVIARSLITLLLPSFFGALHPTKEIRHDKGAQERAENSVRFRILSPSVF